MFIKILWKEDCGLPKNILVNWKILNASNKKYNYNLEPTKIKIKNRKKIYFNCMDKVYFRAVYSLLLWLLKMNILVVGKYFFIVILGKHLCEQVVRHIIRLIQ